VLHTYMYISLLLYLYMSRGFRYVIIIIFAADREIMPNRYSYDIYRTVHIRSDSVIAGKTHDDSFLIQIGWLGDRVVKPV